MTPHPSSVVVVGGGIFGCAAAFHLAKRGIRTTLIEPDDFGDHASGNNPGNLNPIHGTPPSLIPLALKSFELHQALAIELAAIGCSDHDLQPVRRILLAFNDAERKEIEHATTAFEAVTGFSTLRMNADELFRIEPRLSKDVCAGLLMDGNMSVNSRAVTRGLAKGASLFGATLNRSQVVNIEKRDDHILGVHTPDGFISCDAVLFATGPWVSKINEWLNFDSQVVPIKGEMLRINIPGAGFQYDFTRGLISLYRRGRDECWVGVTREHSGIDETPTEAGRTHLLESAARIIPEVRNATLLEHAASVRPAHPSGLPIVGRVPGWRNAYIANGGGAKGVLLSAGIGLAISEIILTGSTKIPILNFPEETSQSR